MSSEGIDETIKEFNLMLVNACSKRCVRVMKFENCVVYAFEDVGGLQIDGEHDLRIKKLAKQAGYKTTVLDLTGCNSATSTVLGYWADVITQVKYNGGRVIMVGPNEFVLKSIKMVGLDKLCEFSDSLESSLKVINKLA